MDALRVLDANSAVLSLLVMPTGVCASAGNPAVWAGCEDGMVRMFALPLETIATSPPTLATVCY